MNHVEAYGRPEGWGKDTLYLPLRVLFLTYGISEAPVYGGRYRTECRGCKEKVEGSAADERFSAASLVSESRSHKPRRRDQRVIDGNEFLFPHDVLKRDRAYFLTLDRKHDAVFLIVQNFSAGGPQTGSENAIRSGRRAAALQVGQNGQT